MRKILIFIYILFLGFACSSKKGDQKYKTSCISFEHVGEAEGFYPATIISTSKSWCGIRIDSPTDSINANLQVVGEDVYRVIRNYILDNEIYYDKDYIQNKIAYSGYGVKLLDDS